MELNSSVKIYSNSLTEYGTLGGFFKLNSDVVYGITNKHVIADQSAPTIGTPVHILGQPGVTIGTLAYWTRLTIGQLNYLDIALFQVSDGCSIKWNLPDGIAVPSSFSPVLAGNRVFRVDGNGQRINGIVKTASITYPEPFVFEGDEQFTFTGMIEITSQGEVFSEPGDSGSLIFNNAGQIVGVLMGKNSTQDLHYVVPFQNGSHGIDQKYALKIASSN